MLFNTEGAKFCSALSPIVEARKKKKHIQTAPTRRKANGRLRCGPSTAEAAWAGAGAARCPRSKSTEVNANRPRAAAAKAAVRQPAAVAIPAMNTGAAAQPMLPATPCAEKAWPSLAGETLRLSTV